MAAWTPQSRFSGFQTPPPTTGRAERRRGESLCMTRASSFVQDDYGTSVCLEVGRQRPRRPPTPAGRVPPRLRHRAFASLTTAPPHNPPRLPHQRVSNLPPDAPGGGSAPPRSAPTMTEQKRVFNRRRPPVVRMLNKNAGQLFQEGGKSQSQVLPLFKSTRGEVPLKHGA